MDTFYNESQDRIYAEIIRNQNENMTEEDFDKLFKYALQVNQYSEVALANINGNQPRELTKKEEEKIKKYVWSRITVVVDPGVMLTDNDEIHESWKNSVDNHEYWERYEHYLDKEKHWPPTSLDSIDRSSDAVLDLLGNPKSEKFNRRGLLMGDVQSGKTANYTAICNKATDAGYNIIIVLTGVIEDLRIQTQGRLDFEFIGKDSEGMKDGKGIKKLKKVGVSKYNPNPTAAFPVTTVEDDFKKSTADSNGIRLNNMSGTAVFIVKKNVSVLTNLRDWLKSSSDNDPDFKNKSILVLDDEADNAGVNVADKDQDPTKINRRIRQILRLFSKKSYLAITATPFANIFINPRALDENIADDDPAGEDLFPKDFIQVLDVPSNYIGANKIFGDNAPYENRIIIIDRNSASVCLDVKHKKDAEFNEIPNDLKNALSYFVLVNAVRDFRGHENTHRSMMVHMSRFTDVQGRIVTQIEGWLYRVRNDLRNYSKLPVSEAEKSSSYIKYLHKVFDDFDLENVAAISWEKLLSGYLKNAVQDIKVLERNSSKRSEMIDYNNHPEGLRVIAVGGNSFSRGLTLEGLCVSYFYRNVSAYDTLMQMGRWFGYRDGYEDLWYVWMDQATRDNFYGVNESIEELKDDLRTMSRKKRAPKDFGIRIKHSASSLMVTAKNKMRTASSVSVSLSKIYIETPRIYIDQVEHNYKVVSEFVHKLSSGRIGKKTKLEPLGKKQDVNQNYWKKVPVYEIAELISNYATPSWSYKFVSDHLKDFIVDMGMNYWDVCIYKGSSKEKYCGFDGLEVKPSEQIASDDPEDNNIIRISGGKQKIAPGDVTKVGLSKKEYDEVKAKHERPYAKHFMIAGRNPLLMIYVIKPKVIKSKDGKTKDEPLSYRDTLIGLGMGIPDLGEGTNVGKYILNAVELQSYIDAMNSDDEVEE